MALASLQKSKSYRSPLRGNCLNVAAIPDPSSKFNRPFFRNFFHISITAHCSRENS